MNGFYFIGIGGISMSALALYLRKKGYSVRGSDKTESEITAKLRKKGIPVSTDEGEKIEENTVVYSGAISPSHPQMLAARHTGKQLLSRAQLLGEICKRFDRVIAVSGCHGKTTCTAMLSHIFWAAKLPFTCHIGGEDLFFGNFTSYGNTYLITEACEYQKSFLALPTECAVVLNVDRDHIDCYRTEEQIFSAFRQFAQNARFCVGSAEDKKSENIAKNCSFGLKKGDYHAKNLSFNENSSEFDVWERGEFFARIQLSVAGEVNVINALAAIATARLYGVSARAIKKGLLHFTGIKRRFERVGTLFGAPVVCDYAHHPKEIAQAVKTASNLCPKGKIRVVFQPHTYSRTKDLMEQFVACFKGVENPIIYATYAAREQFDGEGSAYALVARLPEACYVQSPEQLKTRLKGVFETDMILVLGAGDIYQIAKRLCD